LLQRNANGLVNKLRLINY